jgi:hypothetical protein
MKRSVLAAALTLGLFSSSCLGPNNAFDGLHHWNKNVSENKWGNEAIFVAFTIIPVYAIAYLGDILIFNSIEWWGGENPIDPPPSGE